MLSIKIGTNMLHRLGAKEWQRKATNRVRIGKAKLCIGRLSHALIVRSHKEQTIDIQLNLPLSTGQNSSAPDTLEAV